MRKNFKKVWIAVIVVSFILTLSGNIPANAKAPAKQVDMLFTHDLHSHLDAYKMNQKGQVKTVGGMARLKTCIDEKKKENPNTLVVDGGDFSMGTLYQTLYSSEAVELRMLGELGYDVTTLGNHEFDYGSVDMANMLKSAQDNLKKDSLELPQLVECNVNPHASSTKGKGAELLSALDAYGMKPYVMIKKGDVSIAVLGVFGIDALDCSPTCELEFEEPVEQVKKTVAQIKSKEDADMIVCLSHSGVNENPKKSEDEILAKEVPDLDVIVSAHTHTKLDQPICSGKTYIVSAGCYGEYMGDCSLTQTSDGRWKMDSYHLKKMGGNVEPNPEILKQLQGFHEIINQDYLSRFDYTGEQVLAENDITFEEVDDLYVNHTESRLGNLMSDAYAYAADDGSDTMPPITVVPSGVVRGTYTRGKVTVSDVFDSFSLGVGEDGITGYPLIKIYLTGKELKTVCEVDASISDLMTAARLYMSGISFSYNPHRMILNKVTNVTVTSRDGKQIPLDDEKLYPVVSDIYSANMLGTVTDLSYGLLKIEPKQKDGTRVKDFNACIIKEDDAELKAWAAIASYMGSFDKNNKGIPQIPQYYQTTHDRKVVEEDTSLSSILKHPNRFFFMIIGVVLVAIILVIFLLILLRKIVKKVVQSVKANQIISGKKDV